MPKAVQFDDYGGIEVLEVRDVPRPEPGPDQVLVAVRAAGINTVRLYNALMRRQQLSSSPTTESAPNLQDEDPKDPN